MILASASPRRVELLRAGGYSFRVVPASIDEAPREGEGPRELVRRLALGKALAVLERATPYELVIGADTVVALDGAIFGKPADAADARSMLRQLSGRTHEVTTGVAIVATTPDGKRRERVLDETTTVEFLPLDDHEIEAYVATGEPLDKAGAYAIQGRARLFVGSISGNYENVVGLPLSRVVREIVGFGREL